MKKLLLAGLLCVVWITSVLMVLGGGAVLCDYLSELVMASNWLIDFNMMGI